MDQIKNITLQIKKQANSQQIIQNNNQQSNQISQENLQKNQLKINSIQQTPNQIQQEKQISQKESTKQFKNQQIQQLNNPSQLKQPSINAIDTQVIIKNLNNFKIQQIQQRNQNNKNEEIFQNNHQKKITQSNYLQQNIRKQSQIKQQVNSFVDQQKFPSKNNQYIKKITQQQLYPTIHTVKNQEIHNLVVNMHKSQKNIKNIPLHRPNHSKKLIKSNLSNFNPNLNRLDHNIKLHRNVINLTVGQIFQRKQKKNDQMKQMLMKQIQQLKQQIKLYENQQEESKQINFPQSYQKNISNQEDLFLNLNLNHNKYHYEQRQQGQFNTNLEEKQLTHKENNNHVKRQNNSINYNTYKFQRELDEQQVSLPNKSIHKNKYYTPRLSKNYQSNIKVQQNYTHQKNINQIKNNEIINYKTPNKISLFEGQTFQGKKNQIIQGKIYSNNKISILQNSNITTQLKDSRFSKLIRQQDNSSNNNLGEENLLNLDQNTIKPFYQNLSKFQGSYSPQKYLEAKIKNRNIGSIINYKQQKQKFKVQLKDGVVDAPLIDQLQKIQEPQRYIKNINFQLLKQLPWNQVINLLKQQLQGVKMMDFLQIIPNGDERQQMLVKFAHKIFLKFGINIQSGQILLNIKKYKNCILFSLNDQQNFIYHYDSKFYFGGWINNQKQKQGFQKNQKYIFKGQYHQNKKEGLGSIKMIKSQNQKDFNNLYNNNEQIYIYYYGNWKNNLRHGYGIQLQFTTNHVIQYKGQWQSSKKNGYGILSIYNKNDHKLIQKYEGQFVAGFKQGKGQQYFSNTDQYKGQYQKNKFHGKGQYIWSNGAIYRGDFVHGIRQGNGQWFSENGINFQIQMIKQSGIKYSNKDTYKGQYKNDKKNGFGIYIWKNGTIYQGQFMNDLKHGQGVIVYEGGKKIKYQWEKGQIVSQYKLQEQQQTNHRQINHGINDKDNTKFRRLSLANKKLHDKRSRNIQKVKEEQEISLQFPKMNNSRAMQQKITGNRSLSISKKMSSTMPLQFNKNMNKIKNRNYIKFKQGKESNQYQIQQ